MYQQQMQRIVKLVRDAHAAESRYDYMECWRQLILACSHMAAAVRCGVDDPRRMMNLHSRVLRFGRRLLETVEAGYRNRYLFVS